MNKILAVFKTQTIKDGFLMGLGTFFTALFGFLFTILMARTLSPEKFGIFSALTSLLAIIYSLGDLGVGPAIINLLPRQPNQEIKIISTSFWFQYLVGLVLAVLLWVLAGFSHSLIPGSLPGHFYLIGSLVFNYILIGWAQSVLTAKRDFLRISLSQIIDSSLKIGLAYYLYTHSGLSISMALAANALAVSLALFLIFSKDLIVVPLKFDKKVFQQMFHFSKWIAISRFFSVLNSKIDIIMLNLLSSSFQAGIYAAASRVTLLFAITVSSLGSVVNPRFSKFETKKDFRVYTKKLLYLISGLAVLLLITVLLADKIIILVFGQDFLQSIRVFQYLSLSMVPFLYSIIFTGALLYTFQNSAYYAYLTFLNIFIIFVVNAIGIPQFGVMAPVFGLFLANIVCLLLGAIKVRKLYQTILK